MWVQSVIISLFFFFLLILPRTEKSLVLGLFSWARLLVSLAISGNTACGGNLSVYMQLPLEPQKGFKLPLFTYGVALPVKNNKEKRVKDTGGKLVLHWHSKHN